MRTTHEKLRPRGDGDELFLWGRVAQRRLRVQGLGALEITATRRETHTCIKILYPWRQARKYSMSVAFSMNPACCFKAAIYVRGI